jgi:hypothetical protein
MRDTNGAPEYSRHNPIQAWRKVSPWAVVVLKGILACVVVSMRAGRNWL